MPFDPILYNEKRQMFGMRDGPSGERKQRRMIEKLTSAQREGGIVELVSV